MSELLVLPPPPPQQQFDKIWKMFDDCIRTDKFKQVKLRLAIGDKGRCALGVVMSYTEVVDSIGLKVDNNKFLRDVCSQFKLYTILDVGLYPRYAAKTREQIVGYLKSRYEKTGIVDTTFISILNDYHDFSFEDFRDLFKEMDV
jgi:hypothetical protein